MLYWIIRAFLTILFKLCFRLKIEGIENIPEKTNCIVIANHTSFLDPFLLGVAIPKKVYWVTLSAFHRSFWSSWFMKFAGALPTGNSSQKAVALLTQEKTVGIFPEGTRSHDGSMREFKRGAALCALKTGRPILPCAIIGAYEAFPRTAFFPRCVPITIRIGKPAYLLKESEEIIDDIYLQEGTFVTRNTIKELLHAHS